MTIWYDFTTTLRNRGRSGIANVEWNIGEALRETVPELRCFESDLRRGLVEIDPATRLASAVYASSGAVAHSVITVSPTWRDRLRVALRTRLGPRADPLIRSMSAAYQLPRTVRRVRAEGWTRRPVRRERPARLSDLVTPDDVVISMGADWDGRLAAHLRELRERTGCTVVTMVYDLVPLTHTHLAFHNEPELFVRYFRELVRASDVVTCISEQSRRDLVEFVASEGVELRRSEVLVLGERDRPVIEGTSERDDFYLCVGTIERRKNIELVYDALRLLDAEGSPLPQVVVAGAPGWGNDDLLAELQLRSTPASRAMVLLGSVDDETLDRLYRTARALLFPSHFEGWGLPVREAAIRGCPVAAGDSPAIREAAAGFAGAVFLPSDDPGPWADYMRSGPSTTQPARSRPWSAVAGDLLGLVLERRAGVTPRSAADAGPSR